ncbi:alpha/beta fold hydrolase [Variovorax paradoxus]|uniref:alpha/beta fold hydrolase n=1 Tax=Variovorax paradoxus TaxID=34073 RepID=UPI0029C93816|nr:alpha/beta hydrolase [Variovorax paradoxus]
MARESTLSIDGSTLAYRCAGNPRSPWLVLLHGWPQSKSIYDPVLDELGKDAHAIAFDLPGIGGSHGLPPAASPCELHALAGLLLRAAESLGAHSIDLLAGDKPALTNEIRNDWTRAYQRPEALKAGFDWYRALESAAQRNARPARIDTPILYLRGDAGGRDIDGYVEGLRRAGAANLRSRLIGGSGEFLPVEAPAATCEALRAFRAELGLAA